MRIVSLNVGLPRVVRWQKRDVVTSIWKSPIAHRVRVAAHNIDGDQQSDLEVHGGPNKAVYAYPSEHYEYWRRELPGVELPWGAFGENLSTEGLLEDDAFVGDRFRIGTAELIVTQPRLPCYKLGVRFGDDQMVKRFMASRRSGIYFKIAKAGELATGDTIERVSRPDESVTIGELVAVFAGDTEDPDIIRRALAAEDLPPFWKEEFRSLKPV
jgi:MOSC domain-containing protein YiiM